MPTWDPEACERYKAYRDRPALDLLLQVPADLAPREIWDLGCGTGEHAALLAARHPGAQVHGLDSSPEMLAQARRRPAKVDWRRQDIADFRPDVPPDLIFSNAALQWVGDHQRLFPRLAGVLAHAGVFACQMPVGCGSAWHVAMREVAGAPAWRERLAKVQGARWLAEDPKDYYDWLAPLCRSIDIWSTTYLHVLEGEEPVVEWMMGIGLRPYLDALDDPALRAGFLDAYRDRLAEVVPARPDGVTLFPFQRLFILARR